MPTPRVIDISHHNTVTDLKRTADAGVWGVIHKATQGTAYTDPLYSKRRHDALAAGMLWGAYHFNTGDSITAQVKHFIDVAQPDNHTLMVLDYEDNRLSQMTIQQAAYFLRELETKLGRPGAIYSGNRLKETIKELTAKDREYVCGHRLWLAQYGPTPKLPTGFKTWWLWQYTGDGVGPMPHSVPGMRDTGLDVNTYAGTMDQLTEEWK